MLQLFKATVLQYSHLHQGYNAFEEKCFGKVLIGFFILISEAFCFSQLYCNIKQGDSVI